MTSYKLSHSSALIEQKSLGMRSEERGGLRMFHSDAYQTHKYLGIPRQVVYIGTYIRIYTPISQSLIFANVALVYVIKQSDD